MKEGQRDWVTKAKMQGRGYIPEYSGEQVWMKDGGCDSDPFSRGAGGSL